MIHIFELTPMQGKKQPRPYQDFVRFLPNCDPGTRWEDPNWVKETLKVQWALGSDPSEEDSLNANVETWKKIFKGIDTRVNDDMDEDDEIHVYSTVSTKNAPLLASIIEARNAWLQGLVNDGASQETIDRAMSFGKIWVPIFERIDYSEEEMEDRGDDRKFRWYFRRWVSL